jgi:hypothetical protein
MEQQQSVKRGRGRPKGARNKVSKEGQTFFRRLMKDKQFRDNYRRKWIALELPPQHYINGSAYAWGKPVEQVEIGGDGSQADNGPVVIMVSGKTYTSGSGDSE